MLIILATYGYLPHYWGGSESYVHWLGQYLQSRGHKPVVIAGATDEHLDKTTLFYEDGHLRAGHYVYEGIPVIACANRVTTREIYSKFHPAWKTSWTRLLKKYWEGKPPVSLLHLHALSSLVNASLIEGAKSVFPAIKTLYSYHVPESCPKGTLLYFNQSMCGVNPELSVCTACILRDKLNTSAFAAKLLEKVMPGILLPDPVPAQLRTRELTDLSIQAYRHFAGQIDHWLVFSHQIENTLLRYGISPGKIQVIRHGIDSNFLTENTTAAPQKMTEQPTIFVFVGRFKMVKGIHTLLRAWMGLEESPARRLWLIGGDRDLDPRIAELLEKSKSRKDIEQLGVLPVEEVRSRLEQAHCIVIPSEWVEIGPLTLHEAIACQTNVIASDIGGCAELAAFYGETCQTFRMGNAADLKNKIKDFQYRLVDKKVRSQSEHNELIVREYERVLNFKNDTSLAEK